jgi:hypothetical protein
MTTATAERAGREQAAVARPGPLPLVVRGARAHAVGACAAVAAALPLVVVPAVGLVRR